MQRGQYYAVMKLLQAAVFAIVLLLVAWGIAQAIEDYMTGTDIFSISVQVLKSAYNSRDIDKPFVRKAKLTDQAFTNDSLLKQTGIPKGVQIRIFCNNSFCKPQCKYYINNQHWQSGCGNYVSLTSGGEINVCACCVTKNNEVKCGLFLDESACNIYMPN